MFGRQSKEISFIDLLNILRFKLIWIIIATFALGGIAFGVSKYVIEPKYTANISLYVYSDASKTSSNDAVITQSEINASQLLANNYIVILESRTVSDRIIKELHLDMDASELQKKSAPNQGMTRRSFPSA